MKYLILLPILLTSNALGYSDQIIENSYYEVGYSTLIIAKTALNYI